MEEPVQKPGIKTPKVELTERDERLFFKAAELDDVETLYKYLQAGMDTNLKDPFGWSVLMCAAAGGASRCIQLLLHCGADSEYSANGTNAEQLAKKKKHTAIAKFIEDFRYDHFFNSFKFNPFFRRKQVEQKSTEVFELIEEKYCAVCDKTHFDAKHETSILHLLKLDERPAEGYAYGIPISNVGYRLLKLNNWMEGQGLGKAAEGRKYPVSVCVLFFFQIPCLQIRTALKRDKKGLGLEKKPQMKVTHFDSLDPQAVQSAKKAPRRTYIRHLDKEITKKKAKEIKLRRSLM